MPPYGWLAAARRSSLKEVLCSGARRCCGSVREGAQAAAQRCSAPAVQFRTPVHEPRQRPWPVSAVGSNRAAAV
eukprot:scaffold111892_cov76-Phaeocystis_antarctica.AAC.1